MSSTGCIEQKGIIEEIDNGTARVHITSFSACAACTSKGVCHAGESSSKYIDVFIGSRNFHKGQVVIVSMKKSMGLKATLLAYFLPFIVLLITLVILTETGVKESFAGLASILVLIPYFLVLYVFKHKLQKAFQFTLNKVI